MIYQIKGRLVKKEDNRLIVDAGGLVYEVTVPRTVSQRVRPDASGEIRLIIYHYFIIESNKAVPMLIGFIDEMERDFFEKFISVSGVGPRAAVRAFDVPVSAIAQAIEAGNAGFLRTLGGIGQQRARQIIAHLQGKVGRFALLQEGAPTPVSAEPRVVEEAKEILKRLQYSARESESMIQKALTAKPSPENVEDLLNEIYRQKM